MSPTSASTPAVSTRQSISLPGEAAFNREEDLTNTVAAEDLDHFPQPAAADGSQHSAATTVPALLSLGSLSGTRKLVRNSEFVPSSLSGTKKLVRNSEFVPSSFSGARKLVRGNDPVANFEEIMSRRKRDRDLNSVKTMPDRQKLP